jgi:hypothetical protein
MTPLLYTAMVEDKSCAVLIAALLFNEKPLPGAPAGRRAYGQSVQWIKYRFRRYSRVVYVRSRRLLASCGISAPLLPESLATHGLLTPENKIITQRDRGLLYSTE